MNNPLRVPAETRFIAALALAVEPVQSLSLLLEIGALHSKDPGPVRRIAEALGTAYEQAANAENWDSAHAASTLEVGLREPDLQAYLAYQIQQEGLTPPALAEALAAVGCAAEDRKRPWIVDDWSIYLDRWRERVQRLFQTWALHQALPAPAPQPAEPPAYVIAARPRTLA